MQDHEPRIAIVGTGPGGFYVAEHLLRRNDQLVINMFDRLPTPFGLVRGGVAPDHPKIKTVSTAFDRLARNPRVKFFGNVNVGIDVSLEALLRNYHATVLATGAPQGIPLGVPGEALPGVHSASDFVGWYNGHPDHRDAEFDFSHEAAVVLGHGNVAADICRMLLMPADDLAKTDIASHALEQLASSRVRRVYLIGRRGAAQAKFSNNELRELGQIRGCSVQVNLDEMALNSESKIELADPNSGVLTRNLEILLGLATRSLNQDRSLSIRFCLSPLAILGPSRVSTVKFVRNRLAGEPFRQHAIPTETIECLACGLVFKSVGFRGISVAGAPFDERRGIIPNDGGRVVSPSLDFSGLFVAGWIKRGATGIIGTNRADGAETVAKILEDLPILTSQSKNGGDAIQMLLKNLTLTDYSDWDVLDRREVELGKSKGKPREKFTSVQEMLAFLQTS